MQKLTLEQAVDQLIYARSEYYLALARLAVAQYQKEQSEKTAKNKS